MMYDILLILPILPFTIMYSKSLKLNRIPFTDNKVYNIMCMVFGIIFGVLIHCTAIIEEYVFDIIFRYILKCVGNVYSTILLTSILFSVLHYHKWRRDVMSARIVYIFILFYVSIVYRSISYWRGDIYYSSICHITYNIISVVLGRIYGSYLEQDDNIKYKNI